MSETEKTILYSYKPASWYGDLWKDAFPAGNGEVGISVYGAVKKETILVNHGNLWHWGERSEIPDVTNAFRETKKLLRDGEYQKANPLTAKALLDAGYESELYKPCPVGDIRIDLVAEEAYSDYKRILKMESGEITVSWSLGKERYERSVFVSRKRNLIVLNLKSTDSQAGFNLFMQLHDTGGEDTRRMCQETDVSCCQKNGMLVYRAKNSETGTFGMVCRVVSSSGSMAVTDEGIAVAHASDTLIVFRLFGEMDHINSEQDAIQELSALSQSYEELLEEQITAQAPLFHSAALSLGRREETQKSIEELLFSTSRHGLSAEFCEILWNYGRYLFISGTDPVRRPFPMYGLWGGRYDLIWSHNMANINIQMIYWHCVTGGYAEYVRGLIEYYWDLMPDLRENAKKVFGLGGIFLPAGTTPGYGVMNQVVPVIVNWIGGAGWIAQHMYDYYLATEDEELLSEKILPFMEEAALFYEEFLTREGDSFQILPSVSPENTPGNLQSAHLLHMAHANPTAKNATMDIAILKELFRNLISVSQKKNRNQEKLKLWNTIIQGLPAYQINTDGAVKEWQSDDLEDFYYHRHFSHLYPVFPGKEMMQSEDIMLLDAFQKAVQLRVQGGQSGWSLIFQACLFARLLKGNQALNALEILARSCLTNSLFSLHNDWRHMGLTLDLDEFEEGYDKAPVQLDASIGFVNAVQEMLLQYTQGSLYLLPALPKQWDCGCLERFTFFSGDLDLKWDLKSGYFFACIRFRRRQEIRVILPEEFLGKQIQIKMQKGNYRVEENGDMTVEAVEDGKLEIVREN